MVRASIITELMRRSAATPDNKTIAQNVVQLMAREGRSDQLLEPLLDREAWNASSESAKLCAALEVDRRLQVEHGGRWRLEGLRDWSCENNSEKECQFCDGYGWITQQERVSVECFDCELAVYKHRLALFTHLPTGAEFSLAPGFNYVEWTNRGAVEGSLDPFLIARWPMTRKYFKPAKEYEDLPAVGIGFDDAVSILKKLGLSLPTPEQWEYACRAGSQTRFYWGDEFDESYVWYGVNSGWEGLDLEGHMGEPQPHSPKEHDDDGKWNAFGLVDMIGNIAEVTDKPYRNMGGSFAFSQRQIEAIGYSIVTPSEQLGFRPVAAVPGLDD